MSRVEKTTLGVISDTHGLVRPAAREVLRACDLIIHVGDIGSPDVIEDLQRIAPVRAVRGNVDQDEWAQTLPVTDVVEVGECFLYLLHEPETLDLDPVAAGFHAVLSGHTHRPLIEHRNGVLFFNPGSAGPRRFDLPVALGKIVVTGAHLAPEIIELV